ncbi:hypothetical protein AB4K20DRAFT_1868275 [Rhizopus microsporus]
MLVKKKTSCISNKSQKTVSRYSSRSRELDKKSLEGLEIKKSRVTEFMKEKSFGVVNVTIRDLGNIKKRKIVSATKRKASDVAAVIPKGIIKRTFEFIKIILIASTSTSILVVLFRRDIWFFQHYIQH